MSSNFSINTNFNNNFDNSIQDFNKVFNDSINKSSKNLEKQSIQNSQSFDEIFNSFTPLQAGAQYCVESDSSKNLSPSAKMAQDIQKGFSGGLNALNTVNKQAEEDFETFASGGDISVHEVMISSQKSSLAMQMAIQLRNQMLNAYNEFKNLQF